MKTKNEMMNKENEFVQGEYKVIYTTVDRVPREVIWTITTYDKVDEEMLKEIEEFANISSSICWSSSVNSSKLNPVLYAPLAYPWIVEIVTTALQWLNLYSSIIISP